MHLLKSVEKCYFCLMKWIKLLLDIYVKGSIHVALSVFSMSSLSLLSLNKNIPELQLLIVFFASYVYYNLIKFAPVGFKGTNQPTIFWNWLKLSTLLSLLILLYLVKDLSKDSWFILALSSIFGVLYVQKELLPISRENGWIKAFLVSLVWALITAVLPSTLLHKDWFGLEIILLFFSHFFLVLALLVPFEIRDMSVDQLMMPNLAQQLGVQKIKWVGYLSLILSIILWMLATDLGIYYQLAYFIFYLITVTLIAGAKIDQPQNYTSLWVEAIPIFLLVSVWVLSFL
jgi:hypothetical protein